MDKSIKKYYEEKEGLIDKQKELEREKINSEMNRRIQEKMF